MLASTIAKRPSELAVIARYGIPTQLAIIYVAINLSASVGRVIIRISLHASVAFGQNYGGISSCIGRFWIDNLARITKLDSTFARKSIILNLIAILASLAH